MFIEPKDDLQKCLDEAHEGEQIELAEGIYRAKSVISVKGLKIKGAGIDRTIIVNDDYSNKIHSDGRILNTFRSWTLAVFADDISIEQISVVNDAGSPEIKGQEAALSVCGNNFNMKNCRLSSTQDTLFLGPLPADLIERYKDFLDPSLLAEGPFCQSFTSCLIEGSIDFVFGCGEASFEGCELRSVYDKRNCGFIAAPAHALSQKSGFTFRNCSFTHDENVGAGSIFLARPWRDHGMCSFINCSYSDHIAPEGFDKWAGTDRDRTARFREYPAVPGRVPWINK
ncbi:MAG: pectinesterase family protein [Eubacteriales bacterium]|nr:pectinesterase family protein [Eubacteriales bacterium]